MIILEWAIDSLAVLTTNGESHLVADVCENLRGTDHSNSAFTVAESAEYVRKWLDKIGVGKGKVTVVLPREAVVTRRLQLPNAPDDELPDMVRFQAATKTSSSLDDLALDFLPFNATSESQERHVMTVTIDRARLARIISVLEAAGLQVENVTTSPLTVAQLVRSRTDTSQQNKPTLIVFQQENRVEISILDEGSLVFTHSMLLSRDDKVFNLKPLQSEITRSVVALAQFHPDVTIDRCYYVGTHDEEIAEFLSHRFHGSLDKINAFQIMPGSQEGYESLIGAALFGEDRVLAIDLLHPRKRIEKPDLRKWYWIAGGATLALMLLAWYGVFSARKSALEANIAALQEQQTDLDNQIKKGEPRLIAHERILNWKASQTHPIAAWTKLQVLLPGTDRLYFSEVKFAPQKTEVEVQFTGIGYARTRKEVDDLKNKLADNGFRVKPQPTVDSTKDPDYPVKFDLFVELLRPSPKSQPPLTQPKSADGS